MDSKDPITGKAEFQPGKNQNSSSDQPPQPNSAFILKEDDKMPLFLIKLWNIVEDPNYYDVIRWDDSGYSFHILDPYSFCRNVLPQYFKHNNLNSLIRQLNMYGFRKMTPIERTSLARAESDQDHLEFSHPCFVREHPELLTQIKRKTAATKKEEYVAAPKTQDLSNIFDEIQALRNRQSGMEDRMNELVTENLALWQQLDSMRATHTKQQQIVNKLVHFLVTLVQPKRLGKRHLLAIDEASSPKKTRGNTGSSTALQTIQSPNLNDILDNLIREFAARNQNQNGSTSGPIISDVTDELDHLTTSGLMSSEFMMPANDGRLNYQQNPQSLPQTQIRQLPPQQQPRNQYYQKQMQVPVQNMNPRMGSPQNMNARMNSPQNMNPMRGSPQNMNHPRMNSPILQNADPTLAIPQDEPFVLSPTGGSGLGFTQNDFADYLSGVDQGIDSCRDLIGDQWHNFDFESLMDGAGTSPEEHVQQTALDQVHPVYNFSPNNMQQHGGPYVNTSPGTRPSPGMAQQMHQQQMQPQQLNQNISSPSNYQPAPQSATRRRR